MSQQHPSKIRLWEPIAIFLLLALVIFYAVNALNTQDWLWFTGRSTVIEPIRIVMVENGHRTTLIPGHADFNRLSEAAEAALSQIDSVDLINLGLSDDTLAYYEQSGVIMELYFARPVTFHTRFRAGEPTQLLIPIEGRHAGNGYFFRGANGEWWFGAIRMANPEPLLDVLASLGYPVTRQAAAGN